MTVERAASPWRSLLATTRDFAAIVRRAMAERRIDSIAVVVLGLVGAMAQIGAIAALLGFLRLISTAEAEGAISWHGVRLPDGLGGLLLASGVLACMLAVAATASYLSVRRARAIGRACMERSVLDLFELVDRASSLPEDMEERDVRDMGVRGSRLTGICVENTIQLIGPSIQVLILFGGLLWIDPLVTGLLLPALLVPLPAIWRFNSSVRASANQFYGGAAQGFGRSVGRGLSTLLAVRSPSSTLREATIATYRATPEVHQFYSTYDDMHLTASRSVLITSLFRPLIIVYVLLLLGWQTTRGELSWPEVIAYLVVLIQAASRSEGLVAQLSVLSRLHTQVEPFIRFREHVVRTPVGPRAESAPGPHAVVIEHGGRTVQARPGRPLQVFTGSAHGRFSLGTLCDQLEPCVTSGASLLKRADFVGRRYQPAGATGARLMTGMDEPDDAATQRIRRLADAMSVRAEADEWWGRVLDADAWADLSPEARAVLQLGPAVCADSPVLLVDIGVLSPVDRMCREGCLSALSDRVVLILAPEYASGSAHADEVVALEDGGVVWVGDTAEWNASAVRARLISTRRGRRPVVADDPSDDETL